MSEEDDDGFWARVGEAQGPRLPESYWKRLYSRIIAPRAAERRGPSPIVWTALSALATLAIVVVVAQFRRPAPPPAAEHDVWDARVTVAEGEVTVFGKGQAEGLLASAGMPLEDGDRVVTGADGRAELALSPESVIELGPSAAMTLADLTEKDTKLELDLGAMVAKLRWVKKLGRQLQVKTPTAVAAVRGTEFGLNVAENGETAVGVFDEGRVEVRATDDLMVKETMLEARQEVRIPPGTGIDTVTREDGSYLRVGELSRLKPYHERVERIRVRQEELGASWTGLSERDRARARRDFEERHEKKLEALPEGERQAMRERLRRPERGEPRPGGGPRFQQPPVPGGGGPRPGLDQVQRPGGDQGQHRGQEQGQHRGQDQGQHRGQDQGQQQGQRQPQHLQRVPGWQERNQQGGQRQAPGGQEQDGGRSRIPGGEQTGGDEQRRPGGPQGPGGGGEDGMRPGGPGQQQGPGGGDRMQTPRLKRLPSLNEQGGPEGGGRPGGMRHGGGMQGGGQEGGGQEGGGMRPQGGPPGGGGMHQRQEGGGGMRPQGGPPGGGHQGGGGPPGGGMHQRQEGGGGMRPQGGSPGGGHQGGGGPPGGGMHQRQDGGGPGGGMRPQGGPPGGGHQGGGGPPGGGMRPGGRGGFSGDDRGGRQGGGGGRGRGGPGRRP